MKWSVVVLIVLGVVAALCAALIVFSMQGGKAGTEPVPVAGPVKDVSYVVAARDLAARTVVESDATKLVTAPPSGAPVGAFTQQALVIGQVLRKPILKDQAFQPSHFTSEGTGVVLAGALEHGKRAVSIPLADSGGIEGLLYPGCMVDVLASMQLKDDKGLGDQPITMTLLPGILVLAVGNQTLVSEVTDDSRALVSKSPASTITLLVDSRQAEMLYLARQRGSVSIALRNPADTQEVGTTGTRLPNLSPLFAQAEKSILVHLEEQRKHAEEAAERERTKARYDLERANNDIELARKQAEIARIELDKKKLETERAAEATVKPQWETRVLRGDKEEIRKFDLPEGQKKP